MDSFIRITKDNKSLYFIPIFPPLVLWHFTQTVSKQLHSEKQENSTVMESKIH